MELIRGMEAARIAQEAEWQRKLDEAERQAADWEAQHTQMKRALDVTLAEYSKLHQHLEAGKTARAADLADWEEAEKAIKEAASKSEEARSAAEERAAEQRRQLELANSALRLELEEARRTSQQRLEEEAGRTRIAKTAAQAAEELAAGKDREIAALAEAQAEATEAARAAHGRAETKDEEIAALVDAQETAATQVRALEEAIRAKDAEAIRAAEVRSKLDARRAEAEARADEKEADCEKEQARHAATCRLLEAREEELKTAQQNLQKLCGWASNWVDTEHAGEPGPTVSVVRT